MLLTRENEQWRMKGDFEGPGTDIDKVCFGDLDGDGIKEILIGWKITRNEKKLTAHKYMPDQSQEQFLTMEQNYSYSEFFTGDFTRDNIEDVIAIALDQELGQPQAELLQCVNQRINSCGRIALTEGVVEYVSAQTGKINSSTFGVILDGSMGGTKGLVTDIIFCDAEGNLVAPLWDPENTPVRVLNVFSADFNKDGLIDIPFVTELPMPENSDEEDNPEDPEDTDDSKKQIFVTVGKTYTGNSDEMFDTVIRMYTNTKEGYYFLVPNGWIDNVAAALDEELRTVTFYELKPADEKTLLRETGEELLQIQVFASDDFAYKVTTPGIEKIFESNGNVYTAFIGTQKSLLSVSLVDVQHALRPILD